MKKLLFNILTWIVIKSIDDVDLLACSGMQTLYVVNFPQENFAVRANSKVGMILVPAHAPDNLQEERNLTINIHTH